jgi:sortase (surface protein transpeptidase)
MIRGRCQLAAAAALLTLLTGCTGSDAHPADPAPQPTDRAAHSRTTDRAAEGLEAARGFRVRRGYQPTPVPVRLRIPKIQVTTSLEPLGRAPDGTAEVPNRPDLAGWYAPGPRPGDPGSAVILGHVNYHHAPAVFYRLRELRAGDQLTVTRADGSSVRFVVQRTQQYDKQQFPTDEVYYPTLRSTLQLITCGGQFDPADGHYKSNIIVFATTKS